MKKFFVAMMAIVAMLGTMFLAPSTFPVALVAYAEEINTNADTSTEDGYTTIEVYESGDEIPNREAFAIQLVFKEGGLFADHSVEIYPETVAESAKEYIKYYGVYFYPNADYSKWKEEVIVSVATHENITDAPEEYEVAIETANANKVPESTTEKSGISAFVEWANPAKIIEGVILDGNEDWFKQAFVWFEYILRIIVWGIIVWTAKNVIQIVFLFGKKIYCAVHKITEHEKEIQKFVKATKSYLDKRRFTSDGQVALTDITVYPRQVVKWYKELNLTIAEADELSTKKRFGKKVYKDWLDFCTIYRGLFENDKK